MQKNFQSKLNLLNITDKYWMGTKICQKKNLKSPQWLRNIKTKKRSLEFFGFKAASMDSRPGFEIGPGGRPLMVYVLYLEGIFKSLRLKGRLSVSPLMKSP